MPSFARTKIQPPRLRTATLMARPALESWLAPALLEQRVVLVCAAAGFGKTSALARQVELLPPGTAVAWVSCDSDDSPVQLLECLVAALEPYDLPWRTDPEALIASAATAATREARRAIVAEIINALDACDVPHGVIVVDDLHRVAHGFVYQFLELLLDRFTPRWTMVLASREEPPLPLARLRAAGQLLDLRGPELLFDAAETQALASRAGLDAQAAASLHTRTGGWPVGLRLALDMLRGGNASAGLDSHRIDRHVFDFLTSEVLDRMQTGLRDFLLACSVLPELTASRCAAVTGDALAAQRLDEIDRAGLFVTPLDDAEPTWRLHDLFRAALQLRLQHSQPQRVPELLRRAAASEPDPQQRLGFLLRAQDWAAAAAELNAQTPALITSGSLATVLHWLARFPTSEQDRLPDLQMALALSGWARWDWPLMQGAAQRAAAGYRRAGQDHWALAAAGYEVVALRAAGWRERSSVAAAALEQACTEQIDHEQMARQRLTGNEPGLVALSLLALDRAWAAFDAGQLERLPDSMRHQMQLLESCSGADVLFRCLPLPMYAGLAQMRQPLLDYVHRVLARTDQLPGELRTLARGLLGNVQLWAGDLHSAMLELQEAAEEVRWRDHPLRLSLYVQAPLNLAHALRGDQDALLRDAVSFETTLRRAAAVPALAQRMGLEFFTLARWMLCAGCETQALALFNSVHGFADPRERPVFALQRSSLPGYLALVAGDTQAALATFEPLLDMPGLALSGLASELRLRVAVLRHARGDAVAAVAAPLQPLFERHAADADIAALWLAGPAVLQQLAQVDWGPALSAAQQAQMTRWAQTALTWRTGQRIHASPVEPALLRHSAAALRSHATPEPAVQASPTPPRPAVVPGHSPLSVREAEVLARLAAGDSNKLIARAFDLSPHTVKRHVANILDKLGLSSRGQAAAWHHEHG